MKLEDCNRGDIVLVIMDNEPVVLVRSYVTDHDLKDDKDYYKNQPWLTVIYPPANAGDMWAMAAYMQDSPLCMKHKECTLIRAGEWKENEP